MEQDVRWIQRFSNFNKAFDKLNEAADPERAATFNDLEKEGLIQRFEYTHELAWNVMKDYLEYESPASIMGSRDATRQAYAKGIISDGEGWMDMIRSRNQTSHTYNEATAEEIITKIIQSYRDLFKTFQLKMQDIAGDKKNDIFS